MNRCFNFTGRRRIPRSRVRIRMRREDGQRAFDAELDLEGLDLPPEAVVYVEAYHRAAYRRVDFGTVAGLRTPADRRLVGVAADHPRFRVKVVQQEAGIWRIVAAADKVLPEPVDREEENRASILPVEYRNLKDRVWELDFEDDMPVLYLNECFEEIRHAARGAPEFVTLVYPEVLRLVLARIVKDAVTDAPPEDDDWPARWLRFACGELRRPRPPESSGTAEAEEWIRETVNAFCARFEVPARFSRLLQERTL